MDESAPQSNTRSSNSKFLIPIAIVIVIIGIIVFALNGKKEDAVVSNNVEENNTRTNSPTEPTSDEDQTSSNTAKFNDGTYSADGEYVSPGGGEKIGVKITLKDGVIADAEVDPKATRPNSIKFQGIFDQNFKPLVVGKKITDVELSRVSGSSLTSGGFNEALQKIKSQAQS